MNSWTHDHELWPQKTAWSMITVVSYNTDNLCTVDVNSKYKYMYAALCSKFVSQSIKPTRSNTYKYSKHYSGNGTADEPLPGFLWWQLDEWRSTKEKAKHVSHDVVTDNHWHWNQKPTKLIHITCIIIFHPLAQCHRIKN